MCFVEKETTKMKPDSLYKKKIDKKTCKHWLVKKEDEKID